MDCIQLTRRFEYNFNRLSVARAIAEMCKVNSCCINIHFCFFYIKKDTARVCIKYDFPECSPKTLLIVKKIYSYL